MGYKLNSNITKEEQDAAYTRAYRGDTFLLLNL